jgi:integrase
LTLKSLDPSGLTFAVESLPLDYDELKPYLANGCVLFVDKNHRGGRLKEPVQVKIPAGTSLGDLDIVSFCIDALTRKRARSIPFVVQSKSMMELAKHLRRHRTSSAQTMITYATQMQEFCEWVGSDPDRLVSSCYLLDEAQDPKRIRSIAKSLEEYLGELQARGLSPSSRCVAAAAVESFFRVNGIELPGVQTPRLMILYRDRAPTPEELQRALDIADLRGKVIVSILALGGFRLGTLTHLTYGHIAKDLESDIVPLHIHVEAEITKGKYTDFDTFIGKEAMDYLKMYLEQRRKGSLDGDLPPEEITLQSPLVRTMRDRDARSTTVGEVGRVVTRIFLKAGLLRKLGSNARGRNDMRPHSLRKYFRTQLAALGVQPDYIEYMMGHKISTYNDIEMKGIEFLRNIYAMSGFCIRPKAKIDVYDVIEEMLKAKGYAVDRDLLKRAVSMPHRTVITPDGLKEERRHMLRSAFLEMLKEELRKDLA